MIRLPIKATPEIQVVANNLFSKLKKHNLMSHDNELLESPTTHLNIDVWMGKATEVHELNDSYSKLNLSEQELAILLRLLYKEGSLELKDNIITIDFYI